MLTGQNLNEGTAPLVSPQQKEALLGHRGRVIWMTGLSGAGKTTLAYTLEQRLFEHQVHTGVLDGDKLRRGLNAGLGFTAADREENVRRTAEMARYMAECGLVVICSLITPTNALRDLARQIIGSDYFTLYYLSTPLMVCERRDVKGHYKKARTGEIPAFTGISDVFELPHHADFSLDTSELSIAQSVDRLFSDIYPLIAKNRK